MKTNDPYRVLGVEPTATDDEIKRAYRERSVASHPDRQGDTPKANEAQRALNAAYDAIKDVDARAAYQARIRAEAKPDAGAKQQATWSQWQAEWARLQAEGHPLAVAFNVATEGIKVVLQHRADKAAQRDAEERALARRMCVATKSDGEPCRAFARKDDPGQRCAAHATWQKPKKKKARFVRRPRARETSATMTLTR